MVSGDRGRDGTGDVERGLEPAQARAAAARRHRPTAAGAGRSERGPRVVQRSATPQFGPAEAAVADGGAPPAPAAGAPAWSAEKRTGALAEAGSAEAGAALAADFYPL